MSDELGPILPSKAPDGGMSERVDESVTTASLICGREDCPRTTGDVFGLVSEQFFRLAAPRLHTTIGVRGERGDSAGVSANG